MKCIECGHELKDGAIFCIRCGAMQVSMDGKPIERGEDWPDVDVQADRTGYRSSTDGALHSAQSKNPRGFQPAPQRNGGRIAAIIIAIIALIAIIAFAVVSCSGQATSGTSEDSTEAASESATAASDSASSASATSSTSSASASSTAASTASASASAASASAASQEAEQAVDPTQRQNGQVEPEPEYYNDYYVLPESSYYYYSYDELNSMSAYDLFLARNEIFARHGRMFNSPELQEYFNSQAWYEPLYTPAQWDSMGNQLTDAEVQNVKVMQQVEKDKGSPYL
ncbi:MAG: YARHG domain-containing protein [Eggerthellaceae bacterium]|nr:YARHG domain-containing protein [Eggerthellaceae bacterium]